MICYTNASVSNTTASQVSGFSAFLRGFDLTIYKRDASSPLTFFVMIFHSFSEYSEKKNRPCSEGNVIVRL